MKSKSLFLVISLMASLLMNLTATLADSEGVTLNEYEAVVVGDDFSCALTKSGLVECWGLASQSQLGRQEISKSLAPGFVFDLKDVMQISAGGRHACAILTNKTLKCWGDNSFGQVGDGRLLVKPIEERWFPTFAHDNFNTSMISLGQSHSCSLSEAGEVKCWGRNNLGQLGIGVFESYRVLPQKVMFSEEIKKIASGANHVCALSESGKVYCWGSNEHGQLGIGNSSNKSAPVLVTSIVGVINLVAGFDKTCAIFADTTAKCWGDGNAGQLGDGDIVDRSLPSQISTTVTDKSGNLTPFKGVKAISLGEKHSCLIDEKDNLWCWGKGGNNRLGIGDTSGDSAYSDKSYPFYSSGATPIMSSALSVSSGSSHSCLIRLDKTVYCWGSNDFQELGISTTDQNSLTMFPLKSTIAPVSNLKVEIDGDSARISWTRDLVDLDWTIGGRSSNAQLLATVLVEDKLNNVKCSASLLKNCRVGPLQPNKKYIFSIQVITSISKSKVQYVTFETGDSLASAIERANLDAKAKAEAEAKAKAEAQAKAEAEAQAKAEAEAKAKAEAEAKLKESESRKQIILVKSPGTQKLSQQVVVIPSSSNSGLKVSARSLQPGICEVTQGIEAIVLLKNAGLCELVFQQAGNAIFDPAPEIRIKFEVAKPPINQSVICTNGAKRTKITGTNPICPKGFKKL
jgi:alpha-tubulin suppressor-like RCC1 family protein